MPFGRDVLAYFLASDEIREAISEPRKIPRAIRERMAEIVTRDIVLGEEYESKDPAMAARRLGPLFYLFEAVRHTEEWTELKHMAKNNRTIGLLCARTALKALFDTFEEMSVNVSKSNSQGSRLAFEQLIRDTLSLWGRRPGTGDIPTARLKAFADSGDAAGLMSDIAREQYVPRIKPFIDEMIVSEDAIEFISMLYPGRQWDRGMADLHKEYGQEIRHLSAIVSRSGELRQVLDEIGRTAAAEAPGNQAVAACSRSELHSVINSHDLQYLLPSELVKLQDPTLKYLFMARWAESKLLTYQLSGKARSGKGIGHRKGPVVALVDTSGSMSGSPELVAKAIVLAAAKKVLEEGRDMQVVLFSSTGQSAMIDLSGRRKMATEFLEFLKQRFGGGTDFNTALRSGLDALGEARYRNADLLFITDGLSKVSDERLLEEWSLFKADHGSQIFTIVVGNDDAGGLERISDRAFVVGNGKVGLYGTLRLTAL